MLKKRGGYIPRSRSRSTEPEIRRYRCNQIAKGKGGMIKKGKDITKKEDRNHFFAIWLGAN